MDETGRKEDFTSQILWIFFFILSKYSDFGIIFKHVSNLQFNV